MTFLTKAELLEQLEEAPDDTRIVVFDETGQWDVGHVVLHEGEAHLVMGEELANEKGRYR